MSPGYVGEDCYDTCELFGTKDVVVRDVTSVDSFEQLDCARSGCTVKSDSSEDLLTGRATAPIPVGSLVTSTFASSYPTSYTAFSTLVSSCEDVEHCYDLTCNEAIPEDENLMCVTDESEQGFPITLHNTNTDDTLVCQSVVLDDDQYQGDYWCPEGYEYNSDTRSCVVRFTSCDSGFTDNLTNGCNNFLAGDSWWNQYTNNCFISEDIPLVYLTQHDVRDAACCFASVVAGFENYQLEEVFVY